MNSATLFQAAGIPQLQPLISGLRVPGSCMGRQWKLGGQQPHQLREKTRAFQKCFDHQLKSQKTDKTLQNNKTRTTEEDERLTTVEIQRKKTTKNCKSARTGQV